MRESTIFALSSGAGRAAIAIVRLSGPEVRRVLGVMVGGLPEPRKASLRFVRDTNGVILDHALVVFFPAPGSATGEDLAEFHLHGGRAVVAGALEALGSMPGCRPAEPGEFTRRVFLNGRIDLTGVEGLADLIAAETAAQRKLALRQATGSQRQVIEGWGRHVLEARALLEAMIDFSDEEDVPVDTTKAVAAILDRVIAEMDRELSQAHIAERIRDGYRIVLAGAPNAGKSSLFNVIARRDAAIISDEPGTTRDVLELHLDVGGYAVLLSDTAGLHDRMAGPVETEGMRRTRGRVSEADLVFWVRDPMTDDRDWEREPIASPLWIIDNKSDVLPPAGRSEAEGRTGDVRRFLVSAATGAGIDGLLDDLRVHLQQVLSLEAGASMSRERQRAAVVSARESIGGARAALERAVPVELIAEDLRRAGDSLGRVTGRVGVEELLGVIFAEFCIGK